MQPRRQWRTLPVLLAALAMTGCTSITMQQSHPDEAPVVQGPAVHTNRTPIDGAFSCFANALVAQGKPRLAFAVGDVKDYTGKYSQNDGSAITQGGALMVYSALGKMGGAVQLQERFDTRIAELELAYIDRRQLGDGSNHVLKTPEGEQHVPWVPYFGGTILRSDYYIVGGITELNYNIQSGGGEFTVNQIGPKARTFTMSVGVDLRVVNTQTLEVINTVSLQKQIVGFEVGLDLFRFFGSNLFDVNLGAKNMEPLQLGIRYALEQGVLELLGAVYQMSPQSCIDQAMPSARADQTETDAEAAEEEPADTDLADQSAVAMATPVASATVAPMAINQAINASPTTADSDTYQVFYQFGDPSISQQSASAIERIVADAEAGKSVDVQIVAHDNENWSPSKRQELTGQRVRNLRDALAVRGIHPSRIRVAWEHTHSDTSIRRDGAGFQIFAIVNVTPH